MLSITNLKILIYLFAFVFFVMLVLVISLVPSKDIGVETLNGFAEYIFAVLFHFLK